MDTPTKQETSSNVEELTPGTRDDAYYNFWDERKARITKRLNLEQEMVLDEEKVFKVSDVILKRYACGRLVVRVTFIGKPGITQRGDPVVTIFGMDETGEISFQAYRDNVEKVLEVAKIGEVVEIQGFYASKEKIGRFSNSRTGRDIRLTLHDNSTVQKASSETIPEIPFAFTMLSDIEDKPVESTVDVRGIIVRVCDNAFGSRDVFITDSVQTTTKVGLYKDWKDSVKAEDCFKCLVLRRAVVRELAIGRKYLMADWSTLVLVNPMLPEVEEMKKWFKDMVDDSQ